jgi:hypothetical protein
LTNVYDDSRHFITTEHWPESGAELLFARKKRVGDAKSDNMLSYFPFFAQGMISEESAMCGGAGLVLGLGEGSDV